MWFTIAFFTYPIALFLTYNSYKNYEQNGLKKLFIACFIFIVPITLLLLERNNLKEITSDLKGIYASDNDTIVINENKFIRKNNTVKTLGTWNLETTDKLSIDLTDNNNKIIELDVFYENGKPKLTDEKKSYVKLN